MSEKETSEEIASIAGRVLAMEYNPATENAYEKYNKLLADAKRLAGSALSQREPQGELAGSQFAVTELLQMYADAEEIAKTNPTFVASSAAIEFDKDGQRWRLELSKVDVPAGALDFLEDEE